MRSETKTKVTKKKPLLDQLLGKDTEVEEVKTTTTITMPDGSKRIETRTETRKIDKTPKKTYVKESSAPSRSYSSSSSSPASSYSSPSRPASSAANTFCSACGEKGKPGGKFCELCGNPVVAKASPAAASSRSADAFSCDSCGCRLPPGGKFCEQCGAPAYHKTAQQRTASPSSSSSSSSSSYRSSPSPAASTRSANECSCGARFPPGGKFCESCGEPRSSGGASSAPSSSSSYRSSPASSSSSSYSKQPSSYSTSSKTKSGGGPTLTPFGKSLVNGQGTNLHKTPERGYRSPSSSSSSSSFSGRTGLSCKTCGRSIRAGETYVERKGRVYCNSHGYDKCKGCKGELSGSYINHKGKKYHDRCFRCSVCGTQLGSKYYADQRTGKPVCERHA